MIPSIYYKLYYHLLIDSRNMQVHFEGRATLINDTDKMYENTSITMIGGQDLKFSDLNTIDFLLQNKVESAK